MGAGRTSLIAFVIVLSFAMSKSAPPTTPKPATVSGICNPLLRRQCGKNAICVRRPGCHMGRCQCISPVYRPINDIDCAPVLQEGDPCGFNPESYRLVPIGGACRFNRNRTIECAYRLLNPIDGVCALNMTDHLHGSPCDDSGLKYCSGAQGLMCSKPEDTSTTSSTTTTTIRATTTATMRSNFTSNNGTTNNSSSLNDTISTTPAPPVRRCVCLPGFRPKPDKTCEAPQFGDKCEVDEDCVKYTWVGKPQYPMVCSPVTSTCICNMNHLFYPVAAFAPRVDNNNKQKVIFGCAPGYQGTSVLGAGCSDGLSSTVQGEGYYCQEGAICVNCPEDKNDNQMICRPLPSNENENSGRAALKETSGWLLLTLVLLSRAGL